MTDDVGSTSKEERSFFFLRIGARVCVYLEEGPDVDVESEVGETGGDDFGAAVVSVLAHFGHQDARPAALQRHQILDLLITKQRPHYDRSFSIGHQPITSFVSVSDPGHQNTVPVRQVAHLHSQSAAPMSGPFKFKFKSNSHKSRKPIKTR